MDIKIDRKELRHDRHTVSLLTDHMVITPKYRGKILTDKVAFITEGVIRATCAEMGIKIIDIAENVDHVHIFFQYPPKYSMSFIAKKIKGRSSRILRNFRIFENGAGIIYGQRAVIMVLWVRAGKLLKNTFLPRIALVEKKVYKPKNANKPGTFKYGV